MKYFSIFTASKNKWPTMKVYRSIEEIETLRNSAVTVGGYDGLHLGHRVIIQKLTQEASLHNKESVLVTFHPHPRFVLQPDNNKLKLLNTLEEKIELAESLGIEHFVVIPFNKDFAALSYQQFIEDILVSKIGLKKLIIGFNHQFGKDREGDFEKLIELSTKHNFEIEQVEAEEFEGSFISSTRIRESITSNNICEANKLLGYDYSLQGKVVEGIKKGRDLGYPTANINLDNKRKLIPSSGVYAVEAIHKGKTYKGMGSIGTRPTFDMDELAIEVHLFDFRQNIYGDELTVVFKEFIRAQVKFNSETELIEKIDQDKRDAIQLLA